MVIIMENIIHSQAEFATKSRRAEYFFAPNCWATGIANPLHKPMQKPITKKLTEPMLPTAARASEPKNFPTITVSITL